jgi:hypothetical protein
MTPTDSSRFRIRLTRDMAESLLEHFENFAEDEIVTLEVNVAGVWFIHVSSQSVRFLGQADYTTEQLERMRLVRH